MSDISDLKRFLLTKYRVHFLLMKNSLQTILNISEALISIRDKIQLFQFVFDTLKPQFGFDDANISLRKENDTRLLLLTSHTNAPGPDHPNTREITETGFLVKDTPYEQLYKKDAPQLILFEEEAKKYPDFIGLQLIQDQGFQEDLYLPLIFQGKKLGALELLSKRKGQLKALDWELLTAIANQLAIALSNILANEEILERRTEKETLLKISEAMTRIRSKEELFDFISTRLKALFNFQHFLLVLGQDNFRTHVHWVVDNIERLEPHDEFDQIQLNPIPTKGTPFEILFKATDIAFFDKEFVISSWPQYPGTILYQKAGVAKSAYCPLSYGGEKLGLLIFHSADDEYDKKINQPLFKNVAELVSSAISNVLANEEIIGRRKEKEILLGISEAMTTIRDRDDFRNVIMGKIHPLVSFADAVTTILNTDAKKYKSFVTLTVNAKGKRSVMAKSPSDWKSVSKSEIEHYKKQAAIFRYELAELLVLFPKSEELLFAEKAGLKYVHGLKLYYADKLIGFLLFHFKKKPDKEVKDELYKNISEQMAVAVSNILANEEILERQREKETLLSISEDIALVRNKEELWNIISKKLQVIFNFQDATIVKCVGDSHHQHMLVYAASDIKEFHTYKNVVHDIFPNEGTTWDYQMGLEGPQVLYLPDLMKMEKGVSHPGYVMMKEMGRVESFGAPLSFAGEKFGFLWFHYLKDELPKEKLSLFGQVADQVAAAVSNILANEEILARQKEKEVLLGISETVNSIRDKNQLLEVISNKVRPHLDFDYFVISLFNDSLTEHLQWTINLDDKLGEKKEFHQIDQQWYPIHNTPIEYFATQAQPFFFTDSEINEKWSDFPGTQLYLKMGMRKSVCSPLTHANKKIGILLFHSSDPDYEQAVNLSFVNNLSQQLSVAVSNILANEEILERQKEKEILLGISEAMTTIRDREDLFQVMMEQIAPLLGFKDAVATQLNEDRTAFKSFLTFSPSSRRKHPKYEEAVNRWIPVEGTEVEYVLGLDDIFRLNTESMIAAYPDSPGIGLMKDTGLTDSIGIKLYYGGSLLGIIFFHFDHEQPIAPGLFKNLGEQLAIAMSNILANEEILNRQKEKEILLSISEAMTTIRDRHDFRRVVMEKIHPLVSFADALTTVLNTDGDQYKAFLTISQKSSKQESYNDLFLEWMPVPETEVSYFKEQGQLFAFDIAELATEFPKSRDLGMALKAGLKYTQGLKLYYAGDLIGFLLFHFKERPDHPVKDELYKNISEQLAVAVSNIQANEDILKRQEEKELLLSISEYLAKVRDWDHLFDTIFESLQPSFGFVDAVITVPTTDHKKIKVLATNAESRYGGNENYEHVVRQVLARPPHFDVIYALDAPNLFTIEDYEQMSPGFEGVALMKEVGLKATWAGALRSAGKDIGSLEFHYSSKNGARALLKSTFSNVVDQFSIAVSNILANEDILERQKEKEILLSISESLGRTRNKEEFWKVVANDIRPIMKFSDAVVVTSKGKAHHAHFLVDAPAESQTSENFKPITRLNTNAGSPYPYNLSFDQPAIVDLEEWAKEAPDYPGALLMKEQGLTESFRGPLAYSGVKFGLLWFHYKAGELPKYKLGLFSQIANQVAAAVSNILASEEILQRQEEKEILLSISEAMTTIRSRQDFYQVVIEKIKPLVQFADSITTVLNRNGKFYKHFLQISAGLSKKLNQVDWQPLASSEVGWYLRQDDIFDTQIGTLLQQFPKSVEVKALHRAGIENSKGLKLNYGGELIGILLFHFKGEERVQLKKELYKNISEQIATAVSNILANEEILEGRKEKETLLSISDDITNIRDRNDLFRVMMSKVKEFIRFEDAVVILWPPERDTHQIFLNIASEKVKNHPNFTDVVNVEYPNSGSAMEKFMAAADLHFWEAEEELKEFSDHPGLQMQIDTGLHYSLNVFLKSGKVPFGILMLHFTEFPHFLTEKKELLKSISDQVGVAVLNILANEEILNRQEEKEKLLHISEVMNTIRHRKRLSQVIYENIRPILGFEDVLAFEVNADKKLFRPLLQPPNKEKMDGAALDLPWLAVKGSPIEQALKQNDELFFLDAAQYQSLAGGLERDAVDLKFGQAAGLKLSHGGQLVGFIYFVLPETEAANSNPSLYKNVSEQLALAVSNVLTNEDILLRQKEKETLLSISEDISKIRNQEELLHIINDKIKKVFNFDDFVIAIQTEQGLKHIQWVVKPTQEIETKAEFALINRKELDTPGTPFEWLFAFTEIDFFTKEKLLERYPDYPGSILYDEMGMQKSVVIPMLKGGVPMGIIMFHWKEPVMADQLNLPLLENTINQVAVAVTNILVNEEVQAEKIQKEALLSISEDITKVRGVSDLMQVIFNRMQSIFHFDDAVVNLWDADGKQFRVLSFDKSTEATEQEGYAYFLSGYQPLEGTPYELIFEKNELTFFSLDFWKKEYPEFPGIKLIDKVGYIEHLILPLWQSGKKIGVLEFHSKEADKLRNQNEELLRGAADQVAVAVSNILANEEILNRQKEKEILLSISEAMTTIRNRQDFYQVVMEKIQPLVRFADAVTTVLNHEGTYFKHFLIVSEAKKTLLSKADWQKIDTSEVGWYLNQQDFFEFDIHELAQQFGKNKEVLAIQKKGIKHSKGIKLFYGGELVGVLLFHFKDDKRLEINKELYKNISEQIATAVSNILANEEILEGRKEKETLLSISEDITNIRDRNDLFRVMMSKVKDFVQFDDAVVIIWPPQRDTFKIFLNMASEERKNHPRFEEVVDVDLPIAGTPMETVIDGESFGIWQAETLLEKYPDFPGMVLQVETGLHYSMNVFLNAGSKAFGVLLLHFEQYPDFMEGRSSLLRGISDQVAVAVLNILANEEILERQEEKETLLGISEAMNTIRHRKRLSQVIYENVRPILGFEDVLAFEVNADKEFFRPLLQPTGKEKMDGAALDLPWLAVKGSPIEQALKQNDELFFLDAAQYQSLAGGLEQDAVDQKLGQAVGLKLSHGGQLVGLIYFVLPQNDAVNSNPSLYKNVSQQLALAVSNVLTNEGVLREKIQKEALLSISEDITKVRSVSDLMQVIFNRMQSIFHFDDAIVNLWDADGKQFRMLSSDKSTEATEQEEYAYFLSGYHPLEGTPYELIFEKNELTFFSLDFWKKEYPEFPGIKLIDKVGYIEHLILPLWQSGKKIGVLEFHSKEADKLRNQNEELLRGAADQVSVAVSNILANEDILGRQREKETLLSISEAMSTIRDRDDLFHIMMEKVLPILHFQDAVSVELNNSLTQYRAFLTVSPNERKQHPNYEKIVGQWLPVANSEVEWILNQDNIFLSNTEDWLKLYPDSLGAKLMLETGLKHSLGLMLYSGGELKGFILFHYTDAPIMDVNRDLYKNLSEQLGVAMSNILANEEILNRQKEKEILLSISEAMTTIRNRQDFYQVVMEKIQPLVRFADAVTTVLNHEGTYFKHFLIVSEAKKTLLSKADWQKIDTSEVGWYLNQQDFFEFDIHGLAQQFGKNKEVLAIQKKGIKHSKGIKLFYGGELVGVLLFHFKDDKRVELNKELYKNISEQIATAVSNILANEDILERQEEKETLLSITKDITNIRNRNDLFRVMMSKVKDYIHFDDAVVLIWNNSADEFKAFLNLASEERKAHPAFKEIVNIDLPIAGTPIETFVRSENLMYWNPREMIKKYPNFPGLTLQLETGLNHSLNLHLKSGNVPFGVLLFHFENPPAFEKSKNDLLLGIADQVSVAVLNILANEEILARQKEKENLLRISEYVSQVRDWDNLFENVFAKLQPIFNFSDAVITYPIDDQFLKSRVFANDINDTQDANLKKLIGDFNRTFPVQPHFREIYTLKQPKLYTIADYEKLSKGFPGVDLMKAQGFAATWANPLVYGEKTIGSLEFHYASEVLAEQVNLSFFTNIASQLSVAVSNILANEEILARQKEKEILLSISEDISAIRNREDLYAVILHKIKKFIPFDDAVVISIDEDLEVYNHILNLATPERAANPNFKAIVNKPLPLRVQTAESIFNKKDFDLIDIEAEHQNDPEFPGWKLMLETNLNYSYKFDLNSGGKRIGVLLFHFAKMYMIPENRKSFILNAVNQISTAVSNILANEELFERQKEKEILLSLSEDMAAIRDRKDLYEVILKKIKPMIPFDASVLVRFDQTSGEYSSVLDMTLPKMEQDPGYRKLMDTRISQKTPAVAAVFGKKDFELISVDEEFKKYPDFEGHSMMLAHDFNYSYKFNLNSGGETIGAIFFHFKGRYIIEKGRKSFITNAINQIATAVKNILANEDILQRQKEKETLLEISETIAAIRDRDDLYQVILSKLQPYLPFKEAVVIGIDHKTDSFRHLMTMNAPKLNEYPLFDEVVRLEQPFKNSALEYIFKLGDFGCWSVNDGVKKFPEFKGFQLMTENNLHHAISFHLRSGKETFAIFLFYFEKAFEIPAFQKSLFVNVMNQISVAVSNILANEEVIKRERTKALQASIGEIITSEKDWQKRYQRISETLRDTVPFDYVSFVLENKENLLQGCGFQKIGHNEYRLIDSAYFFKHIKLSKEAYLQERSKNNYTIPEIYGGQDYDLLCIKDKVKGSIQKMFGLSSNLNVPLALSKNWKFQLSLYSKSPNAYTKDHKELMTNIIPSIIHPLERVLAYDQIAQLNTDLSQEKAYLQEEIKVNSNFEEIVGSSPKLQEVFDKINQVAFTDSTVIITGETGTGKELIARAVHNLSPRNKKLLIKINCATLPAELLESELFGHEKGAFTGSVGRRIGKFELAHKGTIFLDEIGELPLDLQSKLLRVLQEKEFERLGSNQVIKTDARIIAATNRNLEKSVDKGDFRADLFYRLNVFPIELPPLRERREDIPSLATHFLQRFAKKVGKRIVGISNASLKELMGYSWPGNVRELEHVIERSVLIGKGNTLKVVLDKKSTSVSETGNQGLFQVKTLQDSERELIVKTLEFCGGRVRGKGGAAELLNINPATLDSRMKKLGIKKGHV